MLEQIVSNNIVVLTCTLHMQWTIGTVTAKQIKPKRQRRKHHNWAASKTTRRVKKLKQTPRYYAVPFGWRPGIFREYGNARKQVQGYKLYETIIKGFVTIDEAQDFMAEHRRFPPGLKTPFHPAKDTPQPPDDLVYPQGDTTSNSDGDNSDDITAKTTPANPAKSDVQIQYQTMQELMQLIVSGGHDECLDQYEPCKSDTCPYSTGCLADQRWVLLRRCMQIDRLFQVRPESYMNETHNGDGAKYPYSWILWLSDILFNIKYYCLVLFIRLHLLFDCWLITVMVLLRLCVVRMCDVRLWWSDLTTRDGFNLYLVTSDNHNIVVQRCHKNRYFLEFTVVCKIVK